MAGKKSISEKRKLLKKYGFINQDLRKNPSPQQKAAVTRQWKQYQIFLSDQFATRQIPKKDRHKYQRAGYLVRGNRVFINKEGYSRVYIAKDHITLKAQGDRKNKRIALLSPDEIIVQMEKTLKKGLKKGEYMSAKIGDHGTFRWRTVNKEEFEKYINHVFTANMTKEETRKYNKASKAEQKRMDKIIQDRTQNLITQMSLVKVDHKAKDDPNAKIRKEKFNKFKAKQRKARKGRK